jgi:hypothetical protein
VRIDLLCTIRSELPHGRPNQHDPRVISGRCRHKAKTIEDSDVRALLTSALLLLLASPAALAQPREMTFWVVSPANCNGRCLVSVFAKGQIAEDSYARFRALAPRLPPGSSVYLNSPGGSLVGGVLLGLALRDSRASVSVAKGSICASACAYALLGGVERRVPAGARVGIHKFYAVQGASGRRNLAYERAVGTVATALLRDYVASMGASPALVALAVSVDPTTLRFLSAAELRRYRVITSAAPEARRSR